MDHRHFVPGTFYSCDILFPRHFVPATFCSWTNCSRFFADFHIRIFLESLVQFPTDVSQARMVRLSISFFPLKGLYEPYKICLFQLPTPNSLTVRFTECKTIFSRILKYFSYIFQFSRQLNNTLKNRKITKCLIKMINLVAKNGSVGRNGLRSLVLCQGQRRKC